MGERNERTGAGEKRGRRIPAAGRHRQELEGQIRGHQGRGAEAQGEAQTQSAALHINPGLSIGRQMCPAPHRPISSVTPKLFT